MICAEATGGNCELAVVYEILWWQAVKSLVHVVCADMFTFRPPP